MCSETSFPVGQWPCRADLFSCFRGSCLSSFCYGFQLRHNGWCAFQTTQQYPSLLHHSISAWRWAIFCPVLMFPGILAPSLVPAGPGPGINHAFPDQAALVHWPRHYRGQWLMPFWLQARHPKPLPAHPPSQHFDYNTFWKTQKPIKTIKNQNPIKPEIPKLDEIQAMTVWNLMTWKYFVLCFQQPSILDKVFDVERNTHFNWSPDESPLLYDDELCWDSKCSPDGSGCVEMVKYGRVISCYSMILCGAVYCMKQF